MLKILKLSLLVGFGGFFGSLSRYSLTIISQKFSIQWPLGTVVSNILGCLLIGIISELSEKTEVLTPHMRLALGTGFCGGFTTLSSMIYESSEMIRSGEYAGSAIYTAGTFFLSMTAFIIGVYLVKLVTHKT
ncbi:MAG TPA: CrcB family protein [Victivallales bacterium]|nr:CrcB family protein [Victivallales bacterium]